MARVQIPGPESVGYVAPARDPGVRASPDHFGAQVGEALADFGSTLSGVSNKFAQQRQDLTDNIADQRAALDDHVEAARVWTEMQAEADQDPENFHTRVTQRLTETFGQNDARLAEKGLRVSSRAAQSIATRRNRLLQQYGIDAVQAGHNASVVKLGRELETNAMQVATSLASHGDLNAVNEALDGIYATASGFLTPENTEKFRASLNKEVGSSLVQYLNVLQDEGLEAADDNERTAVLVQGEALLDQAVAKGYIDPSEGQRLKREWGIGYAKRVAGSLDPVERLQLLQPGVTGASMGDPEDMAKEILRQEEGFRSEPYWDVNAYRVGYGSDTAGGGKPVTQATRTSREQAEADLDYRLIHREGGMARRQAGAAWDGLPANVKAGLYSVAYNYGSLPGVVVDAVKTGDAARIASAVEGLKANPDRRKREAAIIRGESSVSVSTHGQVTKPGGFFDVLPLDVRREMVAGAQAELARGQGEYVNGIDDYTAFLRAGNMPDGRYSQEELTYRLGPEKGEAAWMEIQDAANYGEDVAAVAMASPEEIETIIARREASLASPEGFRQNAQSAAGIVSAVAARNEMIAKDPALYVRSKDDGVRAAYERFAQEDSPQAARDYAAATLSRQSVLGLRPDQQRILPADLSQQIVSQFRNQPEGGQNAAQLMRSLEAQWGKHWPKVFGELSSELPGTALVVGAMNRPDQLRAAEQLAEAAAVGTSELEKAVGETKNDVRDSVIANLAEFGGTVLLQPGGARTYTTFSEATYQLALSYAAQGDSASRAAERAYEDVLGKAYTFHGTYRIPIEWDDGQVSMGAGAALDNIEGGIAIPPSLGKVDLPGRDEAYLSALKAQGYWVTSPDESGLTLYDGQNYVVRREDGSPFRLTWGELVEHGTGDVGRYLETLPRAPGGVSLGEPEDRSPFNQTLESIAE